MTVLEYDEEVDVGSWPIDPWDQSVASHRTNPRPIVAAPTPPSRHVARVRGSPEPIALHAAPLPGPWRKLASCRGMDPDLFFPRRGQDQTEVMGICATCPVKVACGEYAVGVGALLQGIWGGYNERQRRKARTERVRKVDIVVVITDKRTA